MLSWTACTLKIPNDTYDTIVNALGHYINTRELTWQWLRRAPPSRERNREWRSFVNHAYPMRYAGIRLDGLRRIHKFILTAARGPNHTTLAVPEAKRKNLIATLSVVLTTTPFHYGRAAGPKSSCVCKRIRQLRNATPPSPLEHLAMQSA